MFTQSNDCLIISKVLKTYFSLIHILSIILEIIMKDVPSSFYSNPTKEGKILPMATHKHT